jgi:hypothetical protein
VFGDIDESITKSLLGIFQNHQDKKFFIKNHPGNSISEKNYNNIIFIRDNDQNLDDYDCVIVSNASGAVFKPYYENFPFLVFLDTRFFNLNPILNLNKNIFFFDSFSFQKSLNNILNDNNLNKKLHIIDNRNLEWLNILKNKDINKVFNKSDCLRLIDN